jgi:hypothetical protein
MKRKNLKGQAGCKPALFKIFHCYTPFLRAFLQIYQLGIIFKQNPQIEVMISEVTGSDENLTQTFIYYVGFKLKCYIELN